MTDDSIANSTTLAELLKLLLDGDLTSAQWTELQEILAANPAAAEQYLDISTLHALLEWELELHGALQSPATVVAAPAPAPQHKGRLLERRDWKVRSMAAAIAMLAACLAWIIFRNRAPEPSLTRGPDSARNIDATQPAPVTPTRFDSGFARLMLDGGVSVLIQGPAEYTVVSPSHIRLSVGTLTATVPHSVAGFTVVTNEATITDIGTEFGVLAGEHFTETQVFTGSVAVEPRAGLPARQVLTAGQANRVITGGHVEPEEGNQGLFVRVGDYDARKTADARAAVAFDRWSRFSQNVRRWPGLVAYYDFQQGSAPDLLPDASGNGHDGQLGTGRENTAPLWTSGRWPHKQGLLFEPNAAQSVRIHSDSALNELAKSITIVAWVKPDIRDGDKGGNIIAKYEPFTRKTFEFKCFYQEIGTTPWSLYFGGGDGGPPNLPEHGHRLSSSILPHDGRWMCIAVSSQPGETTRFYVNGKLSSSIPDAPQAFATDAEVIIGAVPWAPMHRFNGKMDELALFNRVLSDQEISDVYDAGRPE